MTSNNLSTPSVAAKIPTHPSSPNPTIDLERRAKARRSLKLFFSLVAGFNILFVAIVALTGNTIWFVALMWSVALSSIICRLVFREGFKDVSFRFGGRRTLAYIAAGLVFPVVVGILSYGTAWLTGLAAFTSPPGGFFGGLLLAVTVTTALGCITTTGEEIGWRGYMLTRLIDAGVPRPVLASGVIWTLWHAPLIIVGLYQVGGGTPLLGLLGFAATTTSAAFLLARVRLATGSIWPAVVLHGAWNSVIQSAFDPAVAGHGSSMWLGEGGILVAIVVVGLTILATRGRWTMLRAPGILFDAPHQAPRTERGRTLVP